MHRVGGRGHGQGPNLSRHLFNNGNNKFSTLIFTQSSTMLNNDSKGQIKQHNYGKETCQIYGRTNHTAITCYYKYNYTTEEGNTQETLSTMKLNGNSDSRFYVDSIATTHMTNQRGKLKPLRPYFGNDHSFVGNGQSLPITHIGDVYLNTSIGKLALKNVLVVPKIKKNLLFVSQLIDDNACSFEFNSSGFVIKDSKQ